MDLTPLNAALHGYTPQPDMTDDRIPQMRALSTNACPNSHPLWLTMGPDTCPPGLTTWGYCEQCYTAGLVPAAWVERVEQCITERLKP
jgi:hypothetical protein